MTDATVARLPAFRTRIGRQEKRDFCANLLDSHELHLFCLKRHIEAMTDEERAKYQRRLIVLSWTMRDIVQVIDSQYPITPTAA